MEYSVPMKELPQTERPRERLLTVGASQLSNRELLAILIKCGTQELSVLGLADRILVEFSSLRELSGATWEELTTVRGIGKAKAAELLAALELGRRAADSSFEVRDAISKPEDAARLVMSEMRLLDREHFVVLMLNTKHRVMAKKTISIGHLDAALVHPRELFKDAIRRSSAAVVLVHNHPSGDPTPSRDYMAVTKRLCEAGSLLGIQVLDHLVVGDNQFVSLKEQGMM